MAPCYGWRSPHTRGARGQALRRLGPRRIIPAYAGSTGPPPAETQRRLHHPRIRGEHDVFADQVAQTKGSSPHTRGALVMVTHTFYYIRIIPAYAGSTRSGTSNSASTRDHPRIRGEHQRGATYNEQIAGSSPHTRGAHDWLEDFADRPGIIPAYAGSTAGCGRRTARPRDHPRIRGEHVGVHMIVVDGLGSSPHTRGARLGAFLIIILGRIIPAYAGSTRAGSICPEITPDHPRIRGEHVRVTAHQLRHHGSSPHTRGAQHH